MADYSGVVIAGCAEIPYQRRRPGGSTLALLADAFRRAIAQAGIAHAEVDGLAVASFTLPPDHAIDVAWQLGLTLRWCMDDALGGASGIDMLQHAARAIQAGDASTIVILSADHFEADDFKHLVENYNRTTRDRLAPLGFGGPNALFALVTQGYAAAHGLARADFGAVCIAQRRWAMRNPAATYRSELTLEEYLAAPFVAEPLCRYDCVPVVSGADAIVHKPFEASSLLGSVQDLLAKGEAARSTRSGEAQAALFDRHSIRAAVTLAIESAVPAMIDELTERVVLALSSHK